MKVRIPSKPDATRAGFILSMQRGYRFICAFAVVLCTTGIAGCVLSIAPIIPESDDFFEPRLVGTWASDDGSSRAVISNVSDEAYAIKYQDEGGVSHLAGRLGVLNDRLILDVWPTPGDDELPETYAELLIQGHFPLVLELRDDELHVSLFEADAFTTAIQDGTIDVPHHPSGERLILRGDSDEVRTALSSYLTLKGRLADEGTWRRVRD